MISELRPKGKEGANNEAIKAKNSAERNINDEVLKLKKKNMASMWSRWRKGWVEQSEWGKELMRAES